MEKGSLVTVEYTLYLDDGTKLDSNIDGDPLIYEHGGGQILPALETALGSLSPGESTKVTLAPADAFGDVDPERFQRVPIEAIPEEAREPGVELSYEDEDGDLHRMRVHAVEDEEAVLDHNHPLAGATLTYDVKIVDIRPGEEES